jgi:hypothetical protein
VRFPGFSPLAFCLAAAAAQAETGPCKPDAFGGTTCGEGVGAARVVEGTASPSKVHAFAWRSTKTPPTEMPHDNSLESVLIRLSDGTVHANRSEFHAAWSPDSRFAVEITDFRWMSDFIRLHAIGADGNAKSLDMKDTMENAARKLLRKIVKNESDYAFSVLGSSGGKPPGLTIDNHGTIKALFLMQVPKREEQQHTVVEGTFKVTERGGVLAVKEISMRRSRVKPW